MKAILFILILTCVSCSQIKETVPEREALTVEDNFDAYNCALRFRYLVAHNSLFSSKSRHIEIFLDDRAFNAENLKLLFSCLSRKYPEPTNLTVIVKTHWNQFPFHRPGEGSSEMPQAPDEYDYNQAKFFRRGETEYFEYSAKLKSPLEKVLIKGKVNF